MYLHAGVGQLSIAFKGIQKVRFHTSPAWRASYIYVLLGLNVRVIPLTLWFLSYFFFFTQILNIFKFYLIKWFHNLKFNITIYNCKIHHKKYGVCQHRFPETPNIFIFLYKSIWVAPKYFRVLSRYWHEKWCLLLLFHNVYHKRIH